MYRERASEPPVTKVWVGFAAVAAGRQPSGVGSICLA